MNSEKKHLLIVDSDKKLFLAYTIAQRPGAHNNTNVVVITTPEKIQGMLLSFFQCRKFHERSTKKDILSFLQSSEKLEIFPENRDKVV